MHRIHGSLPSHPMQKEFSRLFSFSHLLFSLNQQFTTFVQMHFRKIAIITSHSANNWKMHLRNTRAHFMAEMCTTPLRVHAGISTLPERTRGKKIQLQKQRKKGIIAKEEEKRNNVSLLWSVPSKLILLECITFDRLIQPGSWEIWETGLFCMSPRVNPLPTLAL